MRLKELMCLEGRRALITGGAGHLAVAMAETLAEMGADLLLVDHHEKSLASLTTHLTDNFGSKVVPYVCDIEDEAARAALIRDVTSNISCLDILIHNAAFVGTSELEGWIGSFETQTVETWRRAFEVNLTAAFDLSKGLLPLLRVSGKGSIINIGSIYGELGPDWNLYEGTEMGNPAAYAVSKGGLFQLTRWLATTLAPDIRVNAISPGGVTRGQPNQFTEKYIAGTPMRRMAIEDDFRGVTAFLASDASAYLTGQILRVDGGRSVL